MISSQHTRLPSNSYHNVLSNHHSFSQSTLMDQTELPDDDDSELESESDADSSMPTKKKPEKAKWTVEEVSISFFF